jgi:nucleoside 2-deoxyribosyltransferase
MIYLIGSLRNPKIPQVATALRQAGYKVFDDWHAAGPEADDYWRSYEQGRGRSYQEALQGYAADHVFEFDKTHLDRCDTGVLVLPAGRSAHAELGYMKGCGKRTFVVLEEADPERWDVMYLLFGGVGTLEDLLDCLAGGSKRVPMTRITLEEKARSLAQRKAELGIEGRDYVPVNSGAHRTDAKHELLRTIERREK